MAVTSSFIRTAKSEGVGLAQVLATATLGGTYTTGGFTWTPLTVPGTAGSSPLVASSVLGVMFMSPLGYIYGTTINTAGNVVTAVTKIFTAPNTELANNAAVPEASVPLMFIVNRR